MDERNRISNMALTPDVRTFTQTFQVPEPTIGEVHYVDIEAVFPYDILGIRLMLSTGSVDIIPSIDSTPIPTNLSDTGGRITVNLPIAVLALPTNPAHVLAASVVTIEIDDATTDADTLVIQLVCRRIDENCEQCE